jgi:hypothetical protein
MTRAQGWRGATFLHLDAGARGAAAAARGDRADCGIVDPVLVAIDSSGLRSLATSR